MLFIRNKVRYYFSLIAHPALVSLKRIPYLEPTFIKKAMSPKLHNGWGKKYGIDKKWENNYLNVNFRSG